MELISCAHNSSNVQSCNAHRALTKSIQLLTTPCTCHGFGRDMPDVHNSPHPFLRVHWERAGHETRTRLLLCSRLGRLLCRSFEMSGALRSFQDQECISMATLICAYGTTILNNHEPSEFVAEYIWTTDRYDQEQTSPLASLEARWLAPAPALAGLSESAALSRRSFNNASLWPEALRPPSSCTRPYSSGQSWALQCWLSLRSCCAFIATGRIQDAYPCPHVMIRTI